MATLQWRWLVGQDRIKEVFSAAFANETLGHSYLLCGETGTGTFAAALDLSAALLCTSQTVRPCLCCGGCRKVLSYAHPDFHVVMPLALQKEHKGSDGKITEAGWEEFSVQVRQRIEDPYLVQEFTVLPTIPVDWVREVTHAIRRGAVEKGKNIVIIDGIDLMQQESANAMLKTLEEPPADALLLLCCERLHTVLPTIVSRCQLMRFSAIEPAIIRSELISRFSLQPDDPRLDGVVYAGSIGRAKMLFEHIDTADMQNARELWNQIIAQDWLAVCAMIDAISDLGDYSRYENLFMQLLYGIRNAFFTKIEGTENYIINDCHFPDTLSAVVTPHAVEVLVRHCESAISRIRARTNISLVLASFALSVMEFLNEQKQQSH